MNNYYKPESKPKSNLVADNINSLLSTTDNTELKDDYGNKIVVPAGFKIVSDSTTNNAQTVDNGIVIEDVTGTSTKGSQFVWIPVGKIYTDVARIDANAKTIELNRYTFDTDGNSTKQNDGVAETYYQELETSANRNTVAKSITNFKTSVTTNGGYYIGRYEARTTTARSNETDVLTPITVKGTDQVYNYVTQPQAATLSQNIYNSNKFTSDLMNSYSWDTATLFLQTCGTNKKYSRQNSLNTDLLATTGTTNDVQCNVYDMASNLAEWTTESSNNSDFYCVDRGGSYLDAPSHTIYRNSSKTFYSRVYYGFRPLLYVNV